MDIGNIIYDYNVWRRLIQFKPQFKPNIILTRETRIRHLSNFPTIKYTTFKLIMIKLDIIPMDVINYIMTYMIITDKIHVRLLITKMILSLYHIETMNISHLDNLIFDNLTFEEIHEVIILKLYEIVINKNKFALENGNSCLCICCRHIGNAFNSCYSINDVNICWKCYNTLKNYDINMIDCNYFKNDLQILKDIKKLKRITRYKYLEHDSQSHLIFVSKQMQNERKYRKLILKTLITKEKFTHFIQIQAMNQFLFMDKCYTLRNIYNEFYWQNKDNILNFKISSKNKTKEKLNNLNKEFTIYTELTKQNEFLLLKLNSVIKTENKRTKILLNRSKKKDEKLWKYKNFKIKKHGCRYH